MRLTFYGVRGSYPTARRDQIRYGGNTTCLHFLSRSGQHLILDGGSGIRVLGNELMQQAFGQGQGEAIILVTHTHWDHILGFPFFTPFSCRGNHFIIASAGQIGSHIRDILSGQHADLNFPVSFEALMQAQLDYHAFNLGDPLKFGDFRIETVQLNHAGITIGYRIEADGTAITVYTDTGRIRETRLGDGMGLPVPDDVYAEGFLAQLAHCARRSDILVHDTQFFEHEMVGKYHWGHCTVEDALEVARLAEVKHLVLFHHNPDHSDTEIDTKLALGRDLSAGDAFEVSAATEGWYTNMDKKEETG
ncbi:MAG: MBL fold metallo-hydrolase [Anaerolineae bacterium]|nr:MBL fold metallo-hydrolase [Anaerolineae bacterium]